MIKVNLLRDQTAHVRKTFPVPTVSGMGLAYVAVFLFAAGAMSTWSHYIHRQVTAAIEKRANLHIEEARLQKLQKEIEKLQEMKQLHQGRIDVIEQLKESQTGPVLLLNTIIHNIPQNGNLWLISLTQKSDNIKIVGFAQRTEVILDFVSNLASSGIFDSVDIEEIEDQKEASKFSLFCRSIKKTKAE